MKVIDLTHTIRETMPVYPGSDEPILEMIDTYEEDGCMVTRLTMNSHTGTHMDAPAHMVPGKALLDQMPAASFVGKALVIDASDCKAGDKITMAHINKVKAKIDQAEILLFRTGWDKKWEAHEEYFGDYPILDDEVVQYIMDSKKKCVGFDTISIDPIWDEDYRLHKKIFNELDIVFVENLTGLSHCGDELFLFCALPLKYKNADGSPVRAIAIME